MRKIATIRDVMEFQKLIGLQKWNVTNILVLKSKCDSLVVVSETRGRGWPSWSRLDGALQIRIGR